MEHLQTLTKHSQTKSFPSAQLGRRGRRSLTRRRILSRLACQPQTLLSALTPFEADDDGVLPTSPILKNPRRTCFHITAFKSHFLHRSMTKIYGSPWYMSAEQTMLLFNDSTQPIRFFEREEQYEIRRVKYGRAVFTAFLGVRLSEQENICSDQNS